MIQKISDLIDLKSIITIVMVVGLVVAFFQDKVTAEQFVPLVTMILTFYFAKNSNATTESKEEEKVEG